MTEIDLDALELKLSAITRWPIEGEIYSEDLTPSVMLELIRRLREAEKDSERLNAMILNRWAINNDSVPFAHYVMDMEGDMITNNWANPRDAIDEAMKEADNG